MNPFMSVTELRTCDIPLVIVNAKIFEFLIYSGREGDHIKDANATSFLMHSIDNSLNGCLWDNSSRLSFSYFCHC